MKSVRRKRVLSRMRGLTFIGLALIALKVTAVMTLGVHLYAAKVATIANSGSTIDTAIAWLIAPDNVTLAVANSLRALGL